MSAFVVALLGAESTGKTTLAAEIGAALAARGIRVEVVAEFLRDDEGAHATVGRIVAARASQLRQPTAAIATKTR